MAGPLQNAVLLMSSAEWRQFLTAAAAYNARLVYGEEAEVPEHNVRLKLAMQILVVPGAATDLLVTLVSTDPAICTQSGVPSAITEQSIIEAVMSYWTPIAKMRFDEPQQS